MHDEPYWVTGNDVRAINRAEVEFDGQAYVVLNDGYVDAACARPVNLWHYNGERDPITLAVSLLFAVAESHAFKDGNKRTGFYAAVIFLQANGYVVPTLDVTYLAEMIISVIEGEMPQDRFEAVFRADIERI